MDNIKISGSWHGAIFLDISEQDGIRDGVSFDGPGLMDWFVFQFYEITIFVNRRNNAGT